MTAKIQKLGDGFGLLLPKELIEECGLGQEVSVTVHDKTLIVAPQARRPRDNWEEAIQKIPQEAIDRDFEKMKDFRGAPNEWDGQGWQWPEPGRHEKI